MLDMLIWAYKLVLVFSIALLPATLLQIYYEIRG